jgi:putative transposase
MKRAITHLKLDDANAGKLQKLDAVAAAYMTLVQQYVDYIVEHDVRDAHKFDPLPAIETPLISDWPRCAWMQAVGIMSSFYSNQRQNKPTLRKTALWSNCHVVKIEPSRTPYYDYWLRITTLEKRKPVRIPITLYDYAREQLAKGKLCSSVRLNYQDGQWYATFVVEIPDAKPDATGRKIGVDIGIANFITTSEGEFFGHFSESFRRRLEKDVERRRRKQKLNACLRRKGLPTVSLSDKKLTDFVRNEIGRAINQFVRALEPNDLVVLEKLNIGTMRFKSRRMNRLLSAAQLGYLARRLRMTLDDEHIRYRSVIASYSSQECSVCGYVDPRNRLNQSMFRCLWCGHVEHADVNASNVLVKRLDDSELLSVNHYREVKAILLQRFYRRFPDARSASGRLETDRVCDARMRCTYAMLAL